MPEADPARVLAYGRGAQGMVVLHAAALDAAITEVVTENTLVSYRLAVQAGLHKNLSELAIPGVLTRYGHGGSRHRHQSASGHNPESGQCDGPALRLQEARAALAPALAGARSLGEAERIRILRRDWRDPLPVE